MKKLLFLALLPFILSSCASKSFTVESTEKSTIFSVAIPEGQQVQFAASTDGFIVHNATKDESDRWIVMVPANTEFKYFFLVDGVVYIPDCNLKEYDDFGSMNCIFNPNL